MKSDSFRFKACLAFGSLMVFSTTGTVTIAGETCKDSAGNSPCEGTNSPCVCVARGDLNDPDEGFDFAFDVFTDPSNPDVTFKTGHSSNFWYVWSQVSYEDPTPANLGDLVIDSTEPTDNYAVKIKNPNNDNPGAANLKSAVLDDTTSWTGQSNINGSHITGDLLNDLLVTEDSGGSGGALEFTIRGNVYGHITAQDIPSGSALNVGEYCEEGRAIASKFPGRVFSIGSPV